MDIQDSCNGGLIKRSGQRQTRWFGGSASRFPVKVRPQPDFRQDQLAVVNVGDREPGQSQPFEKANLQRAVVRHGHGLSSSTLATPVIVKPSDPWQEYHKVLRIRQGDEAMLACRRTPTDASFAILEAACKDQEAHLYALNTIRGPALLDVLEIFQWANRLFIVAPYISTSIKEIVLCALTPSEAQVASLVGQVSVQREVT